MTSPHNTLNTSMHSYNHEHPFVEYFDFEGDFVEDDMRCIPMIVRYKLDMCCVKLKLREWSLMTTRERENLAMLPCATVNEVRQYRTYLEGLIWKRTGQPATLLPPVVDAPWEYGKNVPDGVRKRLDEHQLDISFFQWNALRVLQRFALVKLSSSDHEHKNFVTALSEFNLV